MVIARKTRKDAGQTVFTSDSRRAATYTEGNIGPMRLFASRAKEGESISYKDASKEYSSAPLAFKEEMTSIIDDFIERSPFLQAELKSVLSKTNGSISWTGLERALNNGDGAKIISASTIRRYITATPGFHYQTTRILPFLNKGTIEKSTTGAWSSGSSGRARRASKEYNCSSFKWKKSGVLKLSFARTTRAFPSLVLSRSFMEYSTSHTLGRYL
jgi:hypothetical protein